MNISAILLLAGSGLRFNSSLPKQFHDLLGKKLYRYSLDTILSSNCFNEVILAVHPQYLSYLDPHPECKIIVGGSSRQKSVKIALKACSFPSHVLIHDGARPFLTKEMINLHLYELLEGKDCINTCIPSSDTINVLENGLITSIPPRKNFLQGQTPQSFCYQKLLKAHSETVKEYTDDCSLMLDSGYKVTYLAGNESNIKITSALDLDIAKVIHKSLTSFSC